MTLTAASHSAGPAAERVTERVRSSFAKQGMLTTLGVELVEAAPGRVVLDLLVRPEVTQQNGFAHAGAITTLADTAAGGAAATLMPEDKDVLSVEFKVNLLSPAVGEQLRATATVVRAGRTITVVSVEVYITGQDGGTDGQAGSYEAASAGPGKQVALMQATMIAVDQPG